MRTQRMARRDSRRSLIGGCTGNRPGSSTRGSGLIRFCQPRSTSRPPAVPRTSFPRMCATCRSISPSLASRRWRFTHCFAWSRAAARCHPHRGIPGAVGTSSRASGRSRLRRNDGDRPHDVRVPALRAVSGADGAGLGDISRDVRATDQPKPALRWAEPVTALVILLVHAFHAEALYHRSLQGLGT